jgi:hypothetical protein
MGVGRIPVFLAAAAVAGATADEARASLFFLFEPTAAKPGDVVTVRTGGTPKSFTLRQRVKPLQRPIRLYLVPNRLAPDVHNRFDPRAHFVGRLVPDRNGRGLLRFTVPPLDTNSYTVGAWCPGCAQYSRGHTWFVTEVKAPDVVERFRPLMLLSLAMPPLDPCPFTRSNGNKPPGQPRRVTWHGNGLLWAAHRLGVLTVPREHVEPDGSIGTKLYWVTTPPAARPTVSGERLDAPASPLRMLGANFGSFSGAANPSWATPVVFPSAGCWRVTVRVGDVSLAYVVNVVVSGSG